MTSMAPSPRPVGRQASLARIDALLRNLRLLEAAGACEVMAEEGGTDGRSSEWWRVLAEMSRNLRCALGSWAWPAASAMEALKIKHSQPAAEDIGEELDRVKAEIQRWTEGLAGGLAYAVFAQAYAYFMELDGERGVRSLMRSLEASELRSPLPATEKDLLSSLRHQELGRALPDGPISSYQALQCVADYMTELFSLPVHALTDIQRFAVRPPYIQRSSTEPLLG